MTRRLLLLAGLVSTVVGLSAQERAGNAEWRTYGGDLANTRYSPLHQINRDNFKDLEVAWRLKTENFGPRPEYNFESTPLMVGGVLYTTAGLPRVVVAADAATGEMLWMHRLDEGERGAKAPQRVGSRGLAYWDDGRSGRIFYVTHGYQLIALDAASGRRMAGFGTDGIVDLKQGMDQEIDPVSGAVGLNATPTVAGDTIIVGAALNERPQATGNVKGYVRGYDARTGKRRWIFHTIPQADEFGSDTWLNDSWRDAGHTGVWGQISVDEDLGIVYLPTEMPTNNYYGGRRPGDNLFSDSLVAVDLKTGERIWHFQFIHHDLWDWDLPCAPILADITVDGRPIKAVAQPTKQGWLYVFDRVTGEPVWPIEERPVPQGDVPGEWYSPTQPFPTKPPAFDRQGVSLDDLIDFTPELKAEAVKIVSNYRLGPIFTPPSVADANGTRGTLMMPSNVGGANWPGGSLDPETGIVYVHSWTFAGLVGLVNDPELDYVRGRPSVPESVQGLPLIKPPWGRITAIDLNRGEIVWQVPHGETPDPVREHPALQGLNHPADGGTVAVGGLLPASRDPRHEDAPHRWRQRVVHDGVR
ncbi:MAG: PQQ-binding-like beta-propeller repeat protein [Acidobacteria bacterium]|nr:PQQ-binding-like beta-propeller repeat protein [Acidobacteriota bacterium]